MVGLMNLPIELIMEIYEHIWPADLENFASTCKRMHLASTTRFKEHRTQGLVYHQIHDRYGHDVPSVVLQLLRDPQKAWYIRQIVFDRNRSSNQDWDQTLDLDDSPMLQLPSYPVTLQPGLDGYRKPSGIFSFTNDDIELLRSSIPGLLFLDKEQTEHLLKETVNGNDAHLKLLLLVLSPNMESLIVTAHTPWRREVENFVHLATSFIRNWALLPSERRPLYFQNISKVYLNHFTQKRHPQGQFNLSVHDYAPFWTLPAIKDFKTGLAGYDPNEPYQWEFGHQSSNLKNFDTGLTHFKSGELQSLLEGTKGLRSFHPASWLSLSVLHRFCRHSLEVLNLGQSFLKDVGLRDLLQDFRQLKRLVIALDALYVTPKHNDSSMHLVKLENIIPKSVESILIYINSGNHRHAYKRLDNDEHLEALPLLVDGLLDYIQDKKENCPRLTGVCLTRFFDFNWNRVLKMDKLRALCILKNVKLNLAEKDSECKVCGPEPLMVLGPDIDRDTPRPPCFFLGK